SSHNPDPRWRALADVVGLYEGRHNFAASGERIRARSGSFDPGWGPGDWIRLDATPSPGLWDALLAAHDAGVEFIADDSQQAVIGVEQAPRDAIVDLRMMGERLWVEAGVQGLGAGATLLPLGAPTTAMALVEGGQVE